MTEQKGHKEMITGPRRVRRQRTRRILILGFLLLFPFTMNYYSMVLPVTGTLKGVITGSFIFWAAFAVSSLFLGRGACGYICPLAGLQEVWDDAAGRRLRRVPGLAVVKYVLFGVWMGALGWAVYTSGGWNRVDLFLYTENITSWDGIHGNFIYFGMFALVLLFAAPLGRRAFCRYCCWYSPLNIIGTKVRNVLRMPSLRLSAHPEKCTQCNLCNIHCTMSLDIRNMVLSGSVEHTECVLCGTCVDVCPVNAVEYTWKAKSTKHG